MDKQDMQQSRAGCAECPPQDDQPMSEHTPTHTAGWLQVRRDTYTQHGDSTEGKAAWARVNGIELMDFTDDLIVSVASLTTDRDALHKSVVSLVRLVQGLVAKSVDGDGALSGKEWDEYTTAYYLAQIERDDAGKGEVK